MIKDGYRLVVWVTDDELQALYNQFTGILRHKLPDGLKSLLKKMYDDVNDNYVEETE